MAPATQKGKNPNISLRENRTVIASGAKQSPGGNAGDCFVTPAGRGLLAMTACHEQGDCFVAPAGRGLLAMTARRLRAWSFATRPVRPFGVLFMLLAIALAAGCGGGPPVSTPQTSAPTAAPAVNSFDELVKAAQKEGTVNIYGTEMMPAKAPLQEAFNKKYGINLDFVIGRPPEVLAKVSAERNAGLYLADMGDLGETTSIMDVKPLKITVPVANLLLPETQDAKNWIGGKPLLLDKDGQVLMFAAMAIPPGGINTDMVKEGTITSWLDLLKPEWKGKIVLSDPTVSGGAPNMLASLFKTFGRERALEILRQLAAQDPVLTRDLRLLQEWVARGKYPIAMGHSIGIFTEFKKAGAPIEILKLKEPRHISGGPGNIIVFANNPHPKATQLYINWLLGKEGATIWSKALGYPSLRTDVGSEWLDPATIPQPTDVFPDEEQMQLRVEMRTLSAQIFTAK